MNLLLTGGFGFVGKHIQNSYPGDMDISCLPKETDICDANGLHSAIKVLKPDAVIHLAAQSNVPESFRDPESTFNINFIGTFKLLTALKNCCFKGKLLYVSSGDVYGTNATQRNQIDETFVPRPKNPYAVSKIAAEALCYQWSQTEQFNITIARPFNHIGPGQSSEFVVSSFAKQIAEIKLGQRKNEISVGDLDVSRDFTNVNDTIMAYQALLDNGKSGEIYNICSGKSIKIKNILKKLIKIAGINPKIKVNPSYLRSNQQNKIVASCEKLKQETGWKPRYSIESTLSDILTYWGTVLK